MFEFGNGVLDTVVAEQGENYEIRVEDPEPGKSILTITNGKTAVVKGADVKDAMRLTFELQQRHAFAEVSGQWGGQTTTIDDILHHFNRQEAFTGTKVALPESDVVLFSDREDYYAENFANAMHAEDDADFRRRASDFSSRNRFAEKHAVFLWEGNVYDHNAERIGYIGNNRRLLKGFRVVDVTQEDLEKQIMLPMGTPNYLLTLIHKKSQTDVFAEDVRAIQPDFLYMGEDTLLCLADAELSLLRIVSLVRKKEELESQRYLDGDLLWEHAWLEWKEGGCERALQSKAYAINAYRDMHRLSSERRKEYLRAYSEYILKLYDMTGDAVEKVPYTAWMLATSSYGDEARQLVDYARKELGKE